MKNLLYAKTYIVVVTISAILLSFSTCSVHKNNTPINDNPEIRNILDPTHSWRVDSLISQINDLQGNIINNSLLSAKIDFDTQWKVAICPHDDYIYAGYLYPAVLANVKARTIILFGVAHHAGSFKAENKIIFDNYTYWKAPYGNIPVSSIRKDIIDNLTKDMYEVNNEIQQYEHSVEAILPFLQYYNRDREIISILVPYMPYGRMNEIAESLTNAIKKAVQQKNWEWGKDYAIVISNDAVHYGDKKWGGNFAFYGTDSVGYKKAVEHEMEIINNCLVDNITPDKIKTFTEYTIEKDDFRKYKWPWCGRYSVPFGLLTAYHLKNSLNQQNLNGTLVGYTTSIAHKPIPRQSVIDVAPANMHHWVGYAAIGYK